MVLGCWWLRVEKKWKGSQGERARVGFFRVGAETQPELPRSLREKVCEKVHQGGVISSEKEKEAREREKM